MLRKLALAVATSLTLGACSPLSSGYILDPIVDEGDAAQATRQDVPELQPTNGPQELGQAGGDVDDM